MQEARDDLERDEIIFSDQLKEIEGLKEQVSELQQDRASLAQKYNKQVRIRVPACVPT